MLLRGISKMNQWVNALADNVSFTLKIHMVKRKNWFRKFSFYLLHSLSSSNATPPPTSKYKIGKKTNKKSKQLGVEEQAYNLNTREAGANRFLLSSRPVWSSQTLSQTIF